MKRTVLLGMAILIVSLVNAQNWSPIDSVKLSLKNPRKTVAGLDLRNSFVTDVPIHIFGIKLGADYGKVALLGSFHTTVLNNPSSVSNSYQFNYLSGQMEYRWFMSHRFRFHQTFQVGIGVCDLRIMNQTTNQFYTRTSMLLPIETGFVGTMRFLKYFGLTAGLGVRASAISGTYFSAPYYHFGIKVFTKEVISTIKKGNPF